MGQGHVTSSIYTENYQYITTYEYKFPLQLSFAAQTRKYL